ncbi:MAG: hypothetical protein H8D62_03140, partial [Bacteroidetes bacterium]|nr:hypothetical protein [Bacteroidota bacterium]
RQMEDLGDGWYHFNDTNSFVIHATATNGANWLYDTLNNINATVNAVNYSNVLGVMDSVKEIGLSNGEIILISQNNGIMQFPNANGFTYDLKGIEGSNPLGEQTLSFYEIFDFQVGDVLEYWSEGEVYDDGVSSFYSRFQIHITSVDYSNDSIFVGINRIGWIADMAPEVYFNNTDTIVYTLEGNQFTNSFNNSEVSIEDLGNGSPEWIKSGKTIFGIDNEGVRYKAFGSDVEDAQQDQIHVYLESFNDTLIKAFNTNYSGLNKIYKEGLGCTYSHYFSTASFTLEELDGYVKNGDTTGYISPLNEFANIEEVSRPKNLLRIVDVLGRESKPKPNVPLFYIYTDGTVEKKIVVSD